jgi:hypothetical protein
MNDLFDIALQDAITMVRTEEDKLFLVKQREKERPGSMLGLDRKLTNIEKWKQIRKENETKRKEKKFEKYYYNSRYFFI